MGRADPAEAGLAPHADVRGDGARQLRALYVIGENPAQSEADQTRAWSLLDGLDHLVVQDIFLTRTAEMAHVVLPAAASWCEDEGTVTSSERRVQRVRKALDPPGQARADLAILVELGRRMGVDWAAPTAEEVWDELRSLSPWHGGMSYARLEEQGGLQWPCPDESHPGKPVPARAALGATRRRAARAVHAVGARAAGGPADRRVPDPADHGAPARLLQHRRADRRLHLAAAARRDAGHRARGRRAARVADGETVRAVSRAGASRCPARYDTTLRPGLAFMTLHFPDDVATNLLTIDAIDPKSGTAEFKATAIRIEKATAAGSRVLGRPGPPPGRRRGTERAPEIFEPDVVIIRRSMGRLVLTSALLLFSSLSPVSGQARKKPPTPGAPKRAHGALRTPSSPERSPPATSTA